MNARKRKFFYQSFTVRCNQHGCPQTIKFNKKFHKFVGYFIINVAGRFIGKQNFRPIDNGSCYGNTLFFTAGKCGARFIHIFFQTNPFKHFIDTALDFIFSHISIGCDGLLNWYEHRDSIALLDFEEAFKEHVHWDRHLPDPYFVRASQKLIDKFADCTVKGMTISAPGFYGPQGRVVRQGLAMPGMLEDFESFEFKGYKITNFEMEGSALAGLAAQLGHNAGTVCCAIAHRYLKDANTDYKPRVAQLVELALQKMTE